MFLSNSLICKNLLLGEYYKICIAFKTKYIITNINESNIFH